MKTTKKSAAKKSTRTATDFNRLEKLWHQTPQLSYSEIAKKVGKYRKDVDTEDAACKGVRAIYSNMLRGVAAWYDSKGNRKKLQPREGMRTIGVGKKAPKSKVVVMKKKKKIAKKMVPQIDGKTLAAGSK
jgi:hypothetical protein